MIHQHPIEGIASTDVGLMLAKSLSDIEGDKKISSKAFAILEDILNSSKQNHILYGEILSIKNLGILLEPDLKFNLNYIFERFSNTNTLFIHWKGIIEEDYLYFLTKESGEKIDIKNLSHIVL